MPHFAQRTKVLDAVEKAPLHLVGVLLPVYGAFGYFFFEEFKKDSNLVCTILVDVLLRLIGKGAEFGPEHTLNIQADNAGENKNWHILCLLCALVEWRCFKEINLNFLMVGHTHEDIDQLFSRLSVALSKHDAATLPEMMEVFSGCCKMVDGNNASDDQNLCGQAVLKVKRRRVDNCSIGHLSPCPIRLNECFDFKKWSTQYGRHITGISVPHCFKITVCIYSFYKFRMHVDLRI